MKPEVEATSIEFIRLPEVKRLTSLSTATIYRMTKSGNFPKQVKLSAQAVGWIKLEVLVWASSRVGAFRS